MSRTDERFRAAHNRFLDLCATLTPGTSLPSELGMAGALGVSRTVVRAVLERARGLGLIAWEGRAKRVIRAPLPADRLEPPRKPPSPPELERQFLDWVLRCDVAPGTVLNVADLARRFQVTPHVVQEFLAALARFGLVERRARGGWRLLGFTLEYALELCAFRKMLELNAVAHAATLPEAHPFWAELSALEARHIALAAQMETRFHDFSLLDEAFHRALAGTVQNRFAAEFQKVIALIFHYHFQWDKSDERARNTAALTEHLGLIAALKARDRAGALKAAEEHLATAKQTLLQSLRGHAKG